MRHWPPGQQLHNNKYIIEAILGGGGFGVTYRAQNPKEDKETGKQPEIDCIIIENKPNYCNL